MDVKLKKYFSGKEVMNNVRFTYDKTSKKRPAWIWVENLPKDAMFLSARINNKIQHYRTYLSSETPLFLPAAYTREEMKKFYDKYAPIYTKGVAARNSLASEFLLRKIKLAKEEKILDVGAGSGISALPFVKKGYTNITLLDYSKKMLAIARKNKKLKACKFLRRDITKMKLKETYGLIFSVFSFASNSYFEEREMPKLWRNIASHLKPRGMFMLMGYDFEPPKQLFKKIKSGEYEIIPGYQMRWYMGKKSMKS